MKENIQEINTDNAAEFAKQWMDVADYDNNGCISIKEFTELFNKLESGLTEDQINEIFNAQEADADGELNLDAFTAAFAQGIDQMKAEWTGKTQWLVTMSIK